MQDLHDAISPYQEEISKVGINAGIAKDGKKVGVSPDAEKCFDCVNSLQREFQAKMSDDLNTASILTGTFQEALKIINGSLKKIKV